MLLSAKPTSISISAPPPIKKLKQTMLSFNTTTHLDPSTTSMSYCEDDSDQEDTNTVTDEEIACISECWVNVCDKQGLTPFQPKDSSTIEWTRRWQGQKKLSFFSKLVCNLSLDNPLYYKSSSILCVLSLFCKEGLEFG